MKNVMNLEFLSIRENESFARSVVACFVLPLNPTLSQINDIKTAVSEGVTNAIIHGYGKSEGMVYLNAVIEDGKIHISIKDEGVGIENIEEAVQPFFTTMQSEERSGMGFTVMQSFMDEFKISSTLNGGTVVEMWKKIA